MKQIAAFLIFLVCCKTSFSQKGIDTIRIKNDELLKKLESIIQVNGSFKEAVFLSEQGYQNKVSPFNYYYDFIKSYTKLTEKYARPLNVFEYRQADSLNYLLNLSLFDVMCKEIPLKNDSLIISSSPFIYNFDDPQGDMDFSSTFVTRLLATHKGNCRSLTYLYKILADEIGAKCWLALAPNHIYIRNYSKKVGWYNTELTSGTFPTDAWIASTGYVSTDAIRSGVYMDTLSNQQSIGLCVLDLAHGYIRQTNNYTDGFVLKCCNLVLKYHPVNPMALLLKAEALKRLYLKQKDENQSTVQNTYLQMEQTYTDLVKSGYREMPSEVYQKWLKTVNQENGSHLNQKLK